MLSDRTWPLLLLAALVLSPAADATEDATAAPLQPQRPDIVATFSSGFVSFVANGHAGSTTLKSGLISLSTDDPYCVASPTTPCRYTINKIELAANDTSVAGQDVKNIRVTTLNAAFGAVDDGTGMRLTIPPGMLFNASGSVDGHITAFAVSPTAPNILSMVIDPQLQQITLHGNLQGSQPGFSLSLTILGTTDAPFANLPPTAKAGPDQQLTTDCFALATLDKSQTTDPNGNLAYSYYTADGDSIGDGSQPVALLPGAHRLTLNAFDAEGARGTDDVVITVVDDGTTKPLPGATVFTIRTPPGLLPENTTVLAGGSLVLKPGAGALGGAAVSFGSGTTTLWPNAVVQGDLWSLGPVALYPNASVSGFIHSPSALTQQPGGTFGGLDTTAPFSPPALLSWSAVVPSSDGPPVTVASSQSVVIGPGNYGAITVAQQGTLKLTSGTYSATTLATQPGAVISVDDTQGPVILYLRGALTHRGTIAGVAGVPHLLVAAASAEVSGTWAGTLLSPNGNVSLGPPPNGPANHGAVFAGGGSVALDAQLVHDSFPWQALRDGRAACALTPVVSCVKQTGPNSYVARFDYANAVEFSTIFVPVGTANRFVPAPEQRNQPNRFLPGLLAAQGKGAFEIPFDGNQLTWVLGGRTATASSSSPRCP